MKNRNLIFKTIALGAMVVGGVSIATAVAARIKRTKDEEDTADAILESESIKENFSGVGGKIKKWKCPNEGGVCWLNSGGTGVRGTKNGRCVCLKSAASSNKNVSIDRFGAKTDRRGEMVTFPTKRGSQVQSRFDSLDGASPIRKGNGFASVDSRFKSEF